MNNCNISFPIHAFLILSYYFDKKNFSFSIFSNFFALSSPFSFRLQNFFFFSHLVDLECWEYTFIFVICVKNFFFLIFFFQIFILFYSPFCCFWDFISFNKILHFFIFPMKTFLWEKEFSQFLIFLFFFKYNFYNLCALLRLGSFFKRKSLTNWKLNFI